MARNEFGNFGSSRPRREMSFLGLVFRLFCLVVVLLILPAAYFGWTDILGNFLEKETPQIVVNKPPVGVGEDPITIRFQVSDEGSGLDEVVVRSEQAGEVKTLLEKKYKAEKVTNDTIAIELAGKKSGLREGKARLMITAFDRSFWSNRIQTVLEIQVDYKRPEIEVISTQHNAVMGGAELVFYRLSDDRDVFSGIKVGAELFPGFQAKKLDKDFDSRPDVYFTFFPIPLDFDEKNDQLRLFARDPVGNMATASIYYHVQPVKLPTHEMVLTREFLLGPVPELFQQYLRLDKVGAEKYTALSSAETSEDLVQRFRLVNEDYRAFIGEQIKPLLSQPKQSRFWWRRFGRLSGGKQESIFGERRHYTFEGLDAGSSEHDGVDLASIPHATVQAANDGIVIFADDLGIYGKAVILDHGFGLSTLYGHLSAISVTEGDRIKKEAEIGKTGNTGLAGGDHLHFEIRLHGVPVRPVEWWDDKWLNEHIERKILDTKKMLGLNIAHPLEG